MLSAQTTSQKLEKISSFPAVLVAGGAGFLGSCLCRALLEKNLKVICLDNLNPDKKENISELLKNPSFVFWEDDVSSLKFTDKIKPSYIFHLAGVEEYLNGEEISLETLLVNSSGTKNLLDLAVNVKAKFLLASSLSLYDQTAYTQHEAKRFSEALVSQYLHKKNLDARIARVRDCYGPNMPLESKNPISKMLKNCLHGNNIMIEGEGLDLLYPSFISDVINGLGKAMFSQNTTGRIFTIVNPQNISTQNLADLLQKKFPNNIKIEFIPSSSNLKFPKNLPEIKKTQEELFWFPQVSLEEGIDKTIVYFKEKQSPKSVSPEKTPASPNRGEPASPAILPPLLISSQAGKKSFFSKISLKTFILGTSLTVVIGLFLLPIFLLLLQTYLALNNLNYAKDLAFENKFDQAGKVIVASRDNFKRAKENADYFLWFFTLVKLRKEQNGLAQTLSFGEELTGILPSVLSIGQSVNSLKEDISGGYNDSFNEDLDKTKTELFVLNEKLSIMEAEWKGKKLFCPLNNSACQKLSSLPANFPIYRELISKAIVLLPSLPKIIATGGQKKYLVLFQNNKELRGGGGFIGSYGLLSLEEGKVIDWKIEDIYSIDGELKGHVDPPDEVLHFLGQPNWYLRDSNVSGDFTLNAKRAVWFFEKETGDSVDGVIAVDLSFAQKLLEAVGPVKLPDFNKTITKDNLFIEAEKASEVDFFPGSTQKKDFLGKLGRELLFKLNSPDFSKYPVLIQKISESVNEKHLQVFFVDESLQNIMDEIGDSGKIITEACDNFTNCPSSNLYLVENNFGANKVNSFISRKIQRITTLSKEGEIKEKVTIDYKNNSPADSWPGGNYKNYLQIYVPPESKLLSFDIGENKKATVSSQIRADIIKNLALDEFLVFESSQSGRTVFSTLINIPAGKEKSVEIIYSPPQKISFKNGSFKLLLLEQKQPGTENDQFELKVGFPAFLTPVSLDPKDGVVKPQMVSYNTTLSTDKKFVIEFSR